MTCNELLWFFQNMCDLIDETAFYFLSDPDETEHFIGCVPKDELPYWVGFCDVNGGCEFRTAEELFDAEVFDGKSLRDRWEEVALFQIGNLRVEEWMEMFGQRLPPVVNQSDPKCVLLVVPH